jgi:glycosyltransferase involved in cell wall biosynthesis
VNPLVSVILPVYNGETTIQDSISSIISQSYTNFELIIINDGSTDKSLEKIQYFTDARIFILNQCNMGLATTLNRGIAISKGKLIARQDQDDISMPLRIEKQVEKFISSKNLVLLGTYGYKVDKNSNIIKKLKFPVHNRELQFLSNFYNPFIHSSIMFRQKEFTECGGYSEDMDLQPPEDFNLWNRLKYGGEIRNLNEFLVKYNVSENNMTNIYKNLIAANYKKNVVNNLKITFSFSVNESETFFNLQFMKNSYCPNNLRIKLLGKFISSSREWRNKYSKPRFHLYFYFEWIKMCLKVILK